MTYFIIFIREKIFEGILELFKVNKMIHFELEKSEEKFQKLDDGCNSFLSFIELNIWANWACDYAVDGLD